jgi:hypothetical protein
MFLVVSGCTVSQPVESPDGTVTTNAVPDPRLIVGIDAARAGNAASTPFNPFAYLIEIGLTAVAAGAGWVAKRKNDKAAANELLLKTVIQAIDAIDDQKVKDAVSAHATKVGVEGRLNTAVQRVGSGII